MDVWNPSYALFQCSSYFLKHKMLKNTLFVKRSKNVQIVWSGIIRNFHKLFFIFHIWCRWQKEIRKWKWFMTKFKTIIVTLSSSNILLSSYHKHCLAINKHKTRKVKTIVYSNIFRQSDKLIVFRLFCLDR